MLGKWTVVFEDKKIIKNFNEGASEGLGYKILDDDAFWSKSEFSNIWAIQKEAATITDEVEHRDGSVHCSLEDEGISFQQFIDKWDASHLAELQATWDVDTLEGETDSEKIARLGARPTSYSS
tara:strand:+ start:533 stop:901 length:369 start_codon:yes stop_codon:yes gene_type:complete